MRNFYDNESTLTSLYLDSWTQFPRNLCSWAQLSLQLHSRHLELNVAQISCPHATFYLQRLELRKLNGVKDVACGPDSKFSLRAVSPCSQLPDHGCATQLCGRVVFEHQMLARSDRLNSFRFASRRFICIYVIGRNCDFIWFIRRSYLCFQMWF